MWDARRSADHRSRPWRDVSAPSSTHLASPVILPREVRPAVVERRRSAHAWGPPHGSVWDPRVERGVFCFQSRRISVFLVPGYPAVEFTAGRSLLWSFQVDPCSPAYRRVKHGR